MTTTTPKHTDNIEPTTVTESSSDSQALPLSNQQPQAGQDIRSMSPTAPMEPPGIPRNSPFSAQLRTQSPSLSPPSGTPVPEPQRAQNVGDEAQPLALDPQISALKAMFPDFDDAILHSVLASVDGNQDQAVDLLLGMSDPNFRSEAPPQPQQPPMTQEDLDEQLARRLMLEEQEQHQQWQHQQQTPTSRRSPRPYGGQHAVNQPPPSTAGTTGPGMGEFQEQFTKIAESGKKTFGAFVSKVKAKIQEFQEPNSSSGGVQPTWGNQNAASYYDPNAQQSPSPQTNYQPYHGHHHHAANVAGQYQSTVHDSNQREPPSMQDSSPKLVQSGPRTASLAVEGYDGTPLHSSTGVAPTQATSLPTKPLSTARGAFGANPTASVPSSPPRGPSPPNPIDGGKLGLLPKKPISLIRDPGQNQPQPPQRRLSDDNDDLEYAENPFEEGRK